MAVWITYIGWEKEPHLDPKHGCYISEEEFAKIPYPVKFLEYDKYREDLRKYYRKTATIFGREEKNGNVTVFKEGQEAEVLQTKGEFVNKYFTEAI
jgi:guanylate kinase